LGAAFIYEMVKFQGDESGVVTGRLSRTVLIFGYIGVLVSFVSALRYFGDNRLGMFAFFSVSATVKVADSAAYFVGKSFGRHKLAPLLSPGKTVEGTLAGLVGGVLGAFITFFLVAPIFVDREQPFAWWAVIIFGLGVTVAGMIGDLAESLLKRVAKTKDSSSWLPGLGGVMDIIDSVLVAAPVAFAIWASGILD
jgi:phosphatidate cytidylyltransferase